MFRELPPISPLAGLITCIELVPITYQNLRVILLPVPGPVVLGTKPPAELALPCLPVPIFATGPADIWTCRKSNPSLHRLYRVVTPLLPRHLTPHLLLMSIRVLSSTEAAVHGLILLGYVVRVSA